MKFIKLPVFLLIVFTGLTSFTYPPVLNKKNSVHKIPASQELFSYLRCHRQAKNIVINWGVTASSGVDHFEVFYSDDNDFFNSIAPVGSTSDLKYSYKHEGLGGGYHYYFIRAFITGGGVIDSAVDVVRIVQHG